MGHGPRHDEAYDVGSSEKINRVGQSGNQVDDDGEGEPHVRKSEPTKEELIGVELGRQEERRQSG
jgi:hypothetical protein